LNELALFAGSGGGILGGHLLGWRTIAAVEIEDYPRRVLLQRQADGLLPRFPVWDDICTFDGHPWRGKVDVISGGFPCQDISAAGKGDGLDGERSGLWTHMARVVSEVRPPFVFVENSPMLTTRGGTRVIADLTSLGYDTRWTVMGAADVGAPHQRNRIWIVAHARELRHKHENYEIQTGWDSVKPSSANLANPTHSRDVWREWKLEFTKQEYNSGGSPIDGSREWWSAEPSVGRVANGVAHRVDRLKAIGNGQVPLCAATAWRILSEL
jgi:DNA (cytosine-5)-methyltransferase 1